MANVRKTIEIIFQGVDNVSASISDISDSLSAFGGKVEAIAEPFSKLADGVLATDAALLALAAGGLTYAFSKSKEFENALIELKKVTDGNQESVETARLNALALSDQYGESSTRILDSTSSFIQAGYNIEEAMGLTKSSMDLVIAGGLEASQSSELLIASRMTSLGSVKFSTISRNDLSSLTIGVPFFRLVISIPHLLQL